MKFARKWRKGLHRTKSKSLLRKNRVAGGAGSQDKEGLWGQKIAQNRPSGTKSGEKLAVKTRGTELPIVSTIRVLSQLQRQGKNSGKNSLRG